VGALCADTALFFVWTALVVTTLPFSCDVACIEILIAMLCPLDCRISSLDHAEAVQYAGLLSMLCQKSRSAVRELDPSNDVTFLRLRSHKHEILVAPGMDLCACIFTFAHVLDMS